MPKVQITGMPKVKIIGLPKAELGMYTANIFANTTTTVDWTMGQSAITAAESKNNRAVASTGVDSSDTSTVKKSSKCGKGWVENSKGECIPEKKGINVINDIIQNGLVTGNAIAQVFENKKATADAEAAMRRNSWDSTVKPGGAMAFGKTQLNEGVEFPNMLTPPNDGQYMGNYFGRSMGQFGGSFMGESSKPSLKIKIIGEPDDVDQMKYGGQSNYGFDSGWKRSYTEMNKTSKDYYKNSMSEDKSSDEEPVLEAEGGETIYKPGDHTQHNLVGPRHTEGGIELTESQVNSKNSNVPSFIFSDTAKLKIKDPAILKQFGISPTKGGITPAAISKKYDLNKYKAIVEDPNSDVLAKATAQLMIDKNERRLAELATVQEKMKGLKAPQFAEQTLQQGSAKFGGGMPTYAAGGVTDQTTKKPTEGPVFTPEQIKAFGKNNVTVSERIKSGDTKVLKHQGATPGGIGTYGNISKQEVEELKKRHSWYFSKHPDFDPKNKNDVGDFQNSYNEEYAKKHGYVYFVPKGDKADRKFNILDGLLGEYTYNAPALDMTPPVVPVVPTVTLTKPPADDVKPLKYTGQPVKQYRAPFDYMLPDKVNMLAHAAVFPRKIFPFNPDLAYNPKPLALEDWRAKAAQRFSTQYAAPSAQLAVYGPTQGLGANLSFLAGQTGQQMAAEDIAPTISRNIDRVNAYNTSEGQRQDTVDAFNNQNKVARYNGYATTLQNYDNAMRQYLKENSDAYARAWKNRMLLGDINDTSRNFIKDPTSGRQTFKNNVYGGIEGLSSGSNSNADLFSEYNVAYNKAYDAMKNNSNVADKEKDTRAHQIAMSYINANKVKETSDPYKNKNNKTSYDFDFSNNSNTR